MDQDKMDKLLEQLAADIHALRVQLVDMPQQRAKAQAEIDREVWLAQCDLAIEAKKRWFDR